MCYLAFVHFEQLIFNIIRFLVMSYSSLNYFWILFLLFFLALLAEWGGQEALP